jgi:hypothetical protein
MSVNILKCPVHNDRAPRTTSAIARMILLDLRVHRTPVNRLRYRLPRRLRSNAMPHFGQSPGLSDSMPGHIGQKYRAAEEPCTAFVSRGSAASCPHPQQWWPSVAEDSSTNFAGFSSNIR